MTEWLQRTRGSISAARPDVQLVVRIHPGERYTKGPSVADVVKQALPELPEHIHLVAANDPVNTYDLVEIADLGLVYTTTVGMEMAMSGVPVIVAGQTHYRGRGFTLDPDSWEAYISNAGAYAGRSRGAAHDPGAGGAGLELRLPLFLRIPPPIPWHCWAFGTS